MNSATSGHEQKIFLDFYYPELKDLGKHFLVVISATLAFSLTFAEKIVSIQKGTSFQRSLLLGAWGLMIVAILAAGIGLYQNFVAGGAANGSIIRGRPRHFKPLVRRVYALYHVAGFSYVISLLLLTISTGSKFVRG